MKQSSLPDWSVTTGKRNLFGSVTSQKATKPRHKSTVEASSRHSLVKEVSLSLWDFAHTPNKKSRIEGVTIPRYQSAMYAKLFPSPRMGQEEGLVVCCKQNKVNSWAFWAHGYCSSCEQWGRMLPMTDWAPSIQIQFEWTLVFDVNLVRRTRDVTQKNRDWLPEQISHQLFKHIHNACTKSTFVCWSWRIYFGVWGHGKNNVLSKTIQSCKNLRQPLTQLELTYGQRGVTLCNMFSSLK